MEPLKGVRVIECGVAVAAPLAARLLAHLGAEVIKVESRTAGAASLYGAPRWAPPDVGEAGPDLAVGRNTFNSEKMSIGLALGNRDGGAIMAQLVAVADVFITNFSPSAVASLEIGAERLRRVNPQLIHISMPGFGSALGPYTTYRSWGPNLSSFSGIDYLTGDPDHPPVMTPPPLVDYVAGYHAVVAVLAALLYRRRSGAGQAIDQAQFETAVACLGPFLADFKVTGRNPERHGNRSLWMAPHGLFPCRGDDSWVAIAAGSDEQWLALGRVAGSPSWASDPRFASLDGRFAHEDELEAALSSWTCRHTARELAFALQAAGVAATPVQGSWDHLADPQLQSRRFWRAVGHDRLGLDVVAAPPFRFSAARVRVENAAPSLASSNERVFSELLGIDDGTVGRLTKANVVEPMAPVPARLVESGQPLERPQWRWALPILQLIDDEPEVERTGRRSTTWPEPEERPSGHDSPDVRSALAGVRVLDLSSSLTAYGTRLLAGLGADVVRIEPPAGSELRELAPRAGETSLYQLYMDAGKRSVTLDLRTEAGRTAFAPLMDGADVLYESCRPGYLDSLGLGSGRLRERYPRLVHASVTPFGQSGPYRDWEGEDLTLWSLSGMLPTCGYPDAPPMIPGAWLSHYMIGALGAAAALAALYVREETGCGQQADVSAHEVLVFTGSGMLAQLDDLAPRQRVGRRALGTGPYGYFQCRDRMICLLALFPDHWQRLSRWIYEVTGDAAVLDERFAGPGAHRYRYMDEVEAHVNALAGRYGADAFCHEAQRRGIPAAPVNRVSDTLVDAHLAARHYWSDIVQPGLGTIRWPGPPYRLGLTPCVVQQPAPALGEHTAEILERIVQPR